ncbi:MAG: hypothetical protein P1U85_09510 [Verrucomicrobiales bacterium]|jgi:tetratricopeptide (TPR) repeat protein|nr:hypothetical protein [Verrucomicrobiales bacterium]
MTESESHQYFSAHCFNEVWRLLEIPQRSEEESLLMRDAAHASLYHWKQREDCQPQNLSIGLWALARVYAVLEKGEEAMQYASACIELSETEDLAPFYLGYAFEAAARAAQSAGNTRERDEHLKKATQLLALVESEEERSMLEADLVDLKTQR